MKKSTISGKSLSIKDRFFQFYPLDKNQIENLWKDSILIFDTNVLFNLYRYSPETSSEFLKTISKLKDRIWLPYQVAFEFHKRRFLIIEEQINVYKEFLKKIENIYSDLENKNRNPFLSENVSKELTEVKSKIDKELALKIKEYENRFGKDNILEKIIEIFSNNCGEEIPVEKLNSIYKDGDSRYKDDVPPGFGDKKKPVPDRYGDLIIWYQILEKAAASKKPIIFITDDGKDDWWLIHSGKTISPRPELLKEFKNKTGQSCHFYKPFQFLTYSNTFLGSQIKNEIIQEVKDLEKIKSIINKNILLKLKVKCMREKGDLFPLINSINNDGYKISLEDEIEDNVYLMCVTLPNIADLERRFTKKYLTELQSYNLHLVDYSKQLIT